jgi:GT2 family glycosyltransferase
MSLIVATYQDDGDLALCLQSLVSIQLPASVEVIIVDQNPDDSVTQLLPRFSSLNLRYIKADFIGANRARNLGAVNARGLWLGFPDDDIVFTAQSFTAILTSLNLPEVSIVSGMTVTADGAPNVLRWHDKPRRFNRWTMFSCVSEATMLLKKELFIRAGGFDERFGPGAQFPAAEGIDLLNRIFLQSPQVVAWYSPDIKLIHPSKVPPWNDWAVARMGSYGIGDGAMLAKNLNPNIVWWGLVTLAAACWNLLDKDHYKRKAFAARLSGMWCGFFRYLKEYRF